MIKKIKKINKDILQINDIECETHNLIFGYNGTGKTMLSKIFHGIENGNNIETSEYKIELENNTAPYIRVFYGEEYIQNNIVGDNKDPVIFSIGEELNDKKREKELISRK